MKGIKLYPTKSQAEFIDKCIEGYIITYNWALGKEYEQYELFLDGKSNKQFLSKYDLQYLYKDFRKSIDILKEVPTHSMINAINDMIFGYESFFKHKSMFNKPKFKYDVGLISSYKPRPEPSSFYFINNMLRIEGLPFKETILTSYYTNNVPSDNIKYINPIIFKNNRTNEYWVNYVIMKKKLDDYFIKYNIPKSDPIGVDVNRKIMYACSNGININYTDTKRIEKHLSDVNNKIKRDNERLNQLKSVDPEATKSNSALYRLNQRKHLYERISNIHRDTAYKGSLEIVRLNPEAIILENLEIKKIMSRPYIADDLQFHPLGIAQKIISEQAFKYNIPVYYAPLHFESSNYCSNCNTYRDIKSNKYFVCPTCGLKLHRDLNAAINLKNWYINNCKK